MTTNKRRKRHNRTKKIYKLTNRTAPSINRISEFIFRSAPKHMRPLAGSNDLLAHSYSPTINRELVLLQSVERNNVYNCNNQLAFELKEPLRIGIPGKVYGKTCVPYYNSAAVRFLLKNLAANKHVDPSTIVPPIQSLSNCWFNTMFVTLFVSDKGRKFFHFFRQLMIEGVQSDGAKIPQMLRNGLALLNYAIDACLTGNEFAYVLDTNAVIRSIYEHIPNAYKEKLPYLTDINTAGNPMRYYGSLIYYLHNKSIQLMFIQDATKKWQTMIINEAKKMAHLPHVIILEIYDSKNNSGGMSTEIRNRPKSFLLKGAKYALDSCVIRDTTQQHFCAVITCENEEMAYDGMSYHRLVPLKWKKHINSDFTWTFEGSNNTNGKPLEWNFLHGYQMLIYYRVA